MRFWNRLNATVSYACGIILANPNSEVLANELSDIEIPVENSNDKFKSEPNLERDN